MKLKSKVIIGLVLLSWICGVFFSFTTGRAEDEYQLTLTKGTTLIYEYTEVDEDLLEYLADTTGVEEYEDLAEIDEGEQIKMVITEIEEKDDHWLITVELYKGKDFNERGEDIEVKVYKKPSDLKDEVLEGEEDEQSHLFFLPVSVEDYLDSFEESVIEDERYYEVDYELYVDDTKFVFDYTAVGYSDAIEQKYSEEGILEEFMVLCNGEDAFKRELIDISSKGNFALSITILSVVSVIATSIIIMTVINKRKRYKKSSDSEKIVEKLLNDIISTKKNKKVI